MKKLLIPIFAIALLFTACSSSDSDVDKEAVITMGAESLEAESGFYSEEYVECLLEGVVELTDITWGDLAEALEQDGNLDSLETATSEEQGEAIGALALTCMADTDILQDLMDDAIEDVIDSADGSPLPAPYGAMEYGDDAELDAIYDLCRDGSDQDCLLLWQSSTVGSEYETFAETCGGRDCDIFSLNGAIDFGSPWGDDPPMEFGDDEYLDELYIACENGDGDACGSLFWEAPFDSEYEQFGLSCGGRWDC